VGFIGMGQPFFQIDPRYEPIFRDIGLDGRAVFEHASIRVWRSIADRENGILDISLGNGRRTRFHVKRYKAVFAGASPAETEVRGLGLLGAKSIPTAPLAAHGRLADGRSFVILEDLGEHCASDILIKEGLLDFDRLLEPTADLAAKLHAAGLHHRDLYLSHFFARRQGPDLDLRLIDAARVRELPWLFRSRWIVKDLAQFWYSTLRQPVSDDQRMQWLRRYVDQRGIGDISWLLRRIRRRIAWMARHDVLLNRRQPHRNVAIPSD
jgi:hypothetical protein